VDAVLALPPPSNVKQLHTFVQKVSYLGRFLEELFQLLSPLHQLTHKGAHFYWCEEHNTAFQAVKDVVSSTPILKQPEWDKEFYANPSIGNDAIGAVLLQKGDKGYMRPVYFANRTLLPTEKNYTEVEKIGLALVFIISVRKFRAYLLPKPFTFLCNSSIMPYMVRQVNPPGKLQKWLCELQEFDFSFLPPELL